MFNILRSAISIEINILLNLVRERDGLFVSDFCVYEKMYNEEMCMLYVRNTFLAMENCPPQNIKGCLRTVGVVRLHFYAALCCMLLYV